MAGILDLMYGPLENDRSPTSEQRPEPEQGEKKEAQSLRKREGETVLEWEQRIRNEDRDIHGGRRGARVEINEDPAMTRLKENREIQKTESQMRDDPYADYLRATGQAVKPVTKEEMQSIAAGLEWSDPTITERDLARQGGGIDEERVTQAEQSIGTKLEWDRPDAQEEDYFDG